MPFLQYPSNPIGSWPDLGVQPRSFTGWSGYIPSIQNQFSFNLVGLGTLIFLEEVDRGGVINITIQLKCLIPQQMGHLMIPVWKLLPIDEKFDSCLSSQCWSKGQCEQYIIIIQDSCYMILIGLFRDSYHRPSIDPINHPHSKVVEQYDLFLVYIHLQHAKITRVLVTHLFLLILPGPFPTFQLRWWLSVSGSHGRTARPVTKTGKILDFNSCYSKLCPYYIFKAI